MWNPARNLHGPRPVAANVSEGTGPGHSLTTLWENSAAIVDRAKWSGNREVFTGIARPDEKLTLSATADEFSHNLSRSQPLGCRYSPDTTLARRATFTYRISGR